MTYTAPWERDYTSHSNPVPPDVHLPWQENPVTDPTPAPSVTVIPSSVPLNSSEFAQQIESEIDKLANEALADAQRKVLGALQQPSDPTVNLSDLTNAAARSRAIRALVIGLGLAVLYGVVAAVGTAGNVDFFSKTGWISFGTLVVGAAVNSAVSYIARLKIEPNAD